MTEFVKLATDRWKHIVMKNAEAMEQQMIKGGHNGKSSITDRPPPPTPTVIGEKMISQDDIDAFESDNAKPRDKVLTTARDLINGDREAHYGTPQDNFDRIAKGWAVLLGIDVTPEQVALCMTWLKMARLINGPHEDSYIDGAAYMALAGELSGGIK